MMRRLSAPVGADPRRARPAPCLQVAGRTPSISSPSARRLASRSDELLVHVHAALLPVVERLGTASDPSESIRCAGTRPVSHLRHRPLRRCRSVRTDTSATFPQRPTMGSGRSEANVNVLAQRCPEMRGVTVSTPSSSMSTADRAAAATIAAGSDRIAVSVSRVSKTFPGNDRSQRRQHGCGCRRDSSALGGKRFRQVDAHQDSLGCLSG